MFDAQILPNGLCFFLHEVLEVVDVPDLRGDCYSFLVRGTNHAIEHESFISRLAETREDEVAADHHSSASLACLTVDGGHVLLICC